MLYKFLEKNAFNQDPHFLGWLRRNELLPPTPEQLELRYLEHDAFIQNGIDWDREQAKMLKDWEAKKVQLDT